MTTDDKLQAVRGAIAELKATVANLGYTSDQIRIRLSDLVAERRTLATAKSRESSRAKREALKAAERGSRLKPIQEQAQ